MKLLFVNIISFLLVILTVSCTSNGNKDESHGNYSGENQEKDFKTYKEACEAQDFETARDFMSVLHDNYLKLLAEGQHSFSSYSASEAKKAEGQYYKAFDYIYNSEIQFILTNFDGNDCKDKLVFLLNEITEVGEKAPEGLCRYYDACVDDYNISLGAYIEWTRHYNHLLDRTLSLAINRDNKDVAKEVLSYFVKNVKVTKGDSDGIVVNGVKVDGNHGYIEYYTEDIDAAHKKFEEYFGNLNNE